MRDFEFLISSFCRAYCDHWLLATHLFRLCEQNFHCYLLYKLMLMCSSTGINIIKLQKKKHEPISLQDISLWFASSSDEKIINPINLNLI